MGPFSFDRGLPFEIEGKLAKDAIRLTAMRPSTRPRLFAPGYPVRLNAPTIDG